MDAENPGWEPYYLQELSPDSHVYKLDIWHNNKIFILLLLLLLLLLVTLIQQCYTMCDLCYWVVKRDLGD